jgi:hypothetical protein
VSDGWGSARTGKDGTPRRHLGVDIMFRRRDPDDLREAYPPGSETGARLHFMPVGIPALAASAGVVRIARRTPRGFTVVVRHAGEWATYYTHLERIDVIAGRDVGAGESLGAIGFDPSTARRLRHLHFELWRGGTRVSALDPAPYLAAWERLTIPAAAPIPTPRPTPEEP